MKQRRSKGWWVWKRVLALVLAWTMFLGGQFSSLSRLDAYAQEQSDAQIEPSDDEAVAVREEFANKPLYDAVAEQIRKKNPGLPESLPQITYGQVRSIDNTLQIQDGADVTSLAGLSQLLPGLANLDVFSDKITDWSGIEHVGHLRISTNVELQDLTPFSKCLGLRILELEVRDLQSLEGIEKLTNLESLSIRKYEPMGNISLKDLSPLEVVSGLSSLTIGNSGIGNEGMEVIAKLSGLQLLILDGNKEISQLPEHMFENMTQLSYLNISGTALKTIPDLSSMDSLSILVLNNNGLKKEEIKGRIPAKFADDENWWKGNFSFDTVIATGDKESSYYIPDPGLYALLKRNADSNRDGILMLSEIRTINSLDIRGEYYGEENLEISDFTGLAELAEQIQGLYVFCDLSETAIDSLLGEMGKMKNLQYAYMSGSEFRQEHLDRTFKLNALTDLTIFGNWNATFSVKNIGQLSNLTSLRLYGGNFQDCKEINKLPKLQSLDISSNDISLAELGDVTKQLKRLYLSEAKQSDLSIIGTMTWLTLLRIRGQSGEDHMAMNLDLSKHSALEDIAIEGRIEKITLPENASGLEMLYIFNSVDSGKRGTIGNLGVACKSEKLASLSIYRMSVADLAEIQKAENLNGLKLEGTGLRNTAGIGNLMNLKLLVISENEGLKELDPGIGKLVNLHNLHLSYNALERLPDLSALCTRKGILAEDSSTKVADRLMLEGNCLDEEDLLKCGLPENFIGDKNWMMKATSRQITTVYGNRVLCYPNLTSAFVYREVTNGKSYSFYTTNDFTIPKELIEYVLNKEQWVEISLVLEGGFEYSVYLEPGILQEWDGKEIALKKSDVQISKSDHAAAKYFDKKPLAYIQTGDTIPSYGSISIRGKLPGITDYRLYQSRDDSGRYEYLGIFLSMEVVLHGPSRGNSYVITDANTYNYHNVQGKFCSRKDTENMAGSVYPVMYGSDSQDPMKTLQKENAYEMARDWNSKNVSYYVGEYFANGTKLFIHSLNYAKRKVVLEKTAVVAHGKISFNGGTDAYYVADHDLSGIAWETSRPIVIGGNAEPKPEPESPTLDIKLPSVPHKVVTTMPGESSAPVAVTKEAVDPAEGADKLIEMMKSSVISTVEVVTKKIAPPLEKDVFEEALKNNKDVTLSVTNDENQLVYSWSFKYDEMDRDVIEKMGKMDLSISFATEKQKEIEEITGEKDAVYISIGGYSGKLPAPATVKSYVGDKYKNGEVVYLYYYNEKAKKVEPVGGGGLKVEAGYITYTLTHCSIYFLSTEAPKEENPPTQDPANSPADIKNSPKTGDFGVPSGWTLMLVASTLMLAELRRKRNILKR